MKKNNNYLLKTLVISSICLMISGCQKSNTFTVEGVVAGAAGQFLYLENTGLQTVTLLDSVKLKPDCKFSFQQPRPEYPDFYRLRLNNNRPIHFTVDSTETIAFIADINNFSTSYTVEGSENSQSFKEIMLAQLDANQEIRKLRDSYGMNLIPDSIYQENIRKAVKTFKDIALKYIFGVSDLSGVSNRHVASRLPVSYFALFQQIDGLWFFDLYDSADSKAFGAVATGYKTFYPESPRAKQLEIMALQSLKYTRSERQKALQLPDAKEVNYVDIELPDLNGQNIKLSEIAVGKTVLVVFSAFQTEWSPALNDRLNELYRRYNNKGFEIYQISLDNDVHHWKNVAYHFPWISVHDPQSIYSSVAATYNVRQLPALFLIDKKGNLVKRIDSVEAMEQDISTVL